MITIPVMAICAVPILASPLILNTASKPMSLDRVANFTDPKTKDGWISLLNNSKKQANDQFAKMQERENNSSFAIDPASTALLNGDYFDEQWKRLSHDLEMDIANDYSMQLYFGYKMREFWSKMNLDIIENPNMDKHSVEYELTQFDVDSIVYYHENRSSTISGSNVMWDHKNDQQISLSNIKLDSELWNLADKVYEKTLEMYPILVEGVRFTPVGDEGIIVDLGSIDMLTEEEILFRFMGQNRNVDNTKITISEIEETKAILEIKGFKKFELSYTVKEVFTQLNPIKYDREDYIIDDFLNLNRHLGKKYVELVNKDKNPPKYTNQRYFANTFDGFNTEIPIKTAQIRVSGAKELYTVRYTIGEKEENDN
ncbi:hypothetical protein [[Acholeplasma] multilocale]|uniref:hypothetical protein n=1 Tax=[Acholeplasma] multilocale TaxID=264638 RepID=UPI0004798D03|nr:hypothetical protein [[Acholeplasma] multilocale]